LETKIQKRKYRTLGGLVLILWHRILKILSKGPSSNFSEATMESLRRAGHLEMTPFYWGGPSIGQQNSQPKDRKSSRFYTIKQHSFFAYLIF